MKFSKNVLRSVYGASKVTSRPNTISRAVFGLKMEISKKVLRSVYDASKVI